MSWVLSSAQFASLWESVTTLDRLPYPVTHRDTEPDLTAYERAQTELRHWCAGVDPQLRAALDTVQHPSVRVQVYAEAATPIRLLGAARAGVATLIEQAAGPDREFGGEVRVFTGPAHAIAGSIMQALPANRPGRTTALTAHHDEVRRPDRGAVLQTVESSAATRLRQLLLRARVCTGFVTVESAGSSATTHLTWLDVAQDGRYLLRGDDVLHAQPCDPQQLFGALEEAVGR
ncbi:hypothetical protein G4X40_09695 [Rhodococcus sp. D2-41]|uniref:ESX secretion-associated protein EspG n=1 Tax=Speluncibacter jeojiensis TaxID=2710754 RepID=UPI00240EE2DE|nr:ESX secretion-associated protein EspG [Rhodococcus sp. D2-41]MDG3010418.1 hypothetical protein [Rhodococcus sp. D2-41]